MEVARGIETGEAPAWQGATRENSGRGATPRRGLHRRSNAAGHSPRAPSVVSS